MNLPKTNYSQLKNVQDITNEIEEFELNAIPFFVNYSEEKFYSSILLINTLILTISIFCLYLVFIGIKGKIKHRI